MNKMYKVAVAMSGGVDSAVSALLLKNKGFDVVGVYMKNWDQFNELGYCSGEKDLIDVQNVCKKLGIDLYEVNFVKEYWNKVFCDFLDDYQNGLTPNPDLLCNKHIKFDDFYKYCFSKFQVNAIATGHYARSSFGTYLENCRDNTVKLLKANDDFKDQTFFLSCIRQDSLKRTMFPVGNMYKKDVKKIAELNGLHEMARKRESTGICFIGDRNFQNFISQYVDPVPGDFIDIDSGKTVGRHNGIHQWTIGQRCRIPGCVKPFFVAMKDVQQKIIYVAAGTEHPSLFSKIVYTSKPHWIRNVEINPNKFYEFRFQHTKPLVRCKIKEENNGLKITLASFLRAITPGQYAVIYSEDECLGSARILPSK
ncbi:mitochondrial tRNA-specific 2-thiouridylase 1 isoform X2 [Condylostylus longicornis]|uniref:mitochondrial tRNA-specific 2-thiouridylase 1 isoform X2 n=1 Tax=Condylostylus longicornis TaxID=2530218 RepID=UPI00244E1352|nr:mitochondrial tRNA-specific 2-thiouridylase 1 isoform X2 [Condylostylus longicornis]